MAKRLTYEEVKQRFENRGFVLLSKEYVGSKSKLEYVCTCGRVALINLDSLGLGQSCYACGRLKGGNRKHTIETVRKLFRESNCTLLTNEYLRPHEIMPYICECGSKSTINLSNFMQGKRCQNCRITKLFGKRTDEWRAESVRKRKDADYAAWRRRVLTRDGNECVVCGERNIQLHVHHIESFTRVKELRTEDSNGATLCVDCHKEYHRNFYWNDADAESFFDFMFGEYRDPWYAGETFD